MSGPWPGVGPGATAKPSGDGSPVASPFGGAGRGPLSSASKASSPFRKPKDPTVQRSAPSPARAATRVGRRQLERLSARLSDRDREVLARVAEHRFLTTDQVQRFVFSGHASEATAARTARRTLTRLQRDGLVTALPRRQGGPTAGSTPAVWRLSHAGSRLLTDSGHSHRFGASVPTTRFLAHCLAVAETHLEIRAGVQAAGWLAEVAVEGAARRGFTGAGGEPVIVAPDLALRIEGRDTQGPFEDCWFVEVDLGSESLPTLLRKCALYEAYRASGIEQARSGVFPLVLWVMNNPGRAAQLRRRIAATARLTPALYRITTLDRGSDLPGVATVLNGNEPGGQP